MAAQNYTLRIKNRSRAQHDFLCYQQGINVNTPYIYTLAWFAKPVADGVDVDFTWSIDYAFVWSEQGPPKPGIAFNAHQMVDADLQTANLINFTDVDGAFQFVNETAAGTAGSLTIACDGTIPGGAAVVGVGMSGQGTHVVPAEPNFAAVFSVNPEYWISFGSFVPGQVIDTQTMVESEQVSFPVNVYGMTATLDSGNNWTVEQGLV
jgi:hypothetical protein